MRPAKFSLPKVIVASALFTALAITSLAAQQQASAQPATSGVGKYNGPGGCAASNCHGSVAPKSITRIRQNEYSIWAAQDKHARAYNVLSNAVSKRMGKILNLETAPNQADKCLACHALAVPANLRAQTFQLEDGVSCEHCHGPAVGWLGPHTTKNWTHEQSLKLGMYDTRDLIKRSEKCMSCHVGTSENRVDHEMIAAGHPDLTFELDTFSAVMPRHWKFPEEKNPWAGVQNWSVGQAVQLREALNRLGRSAGGPKWPEFAELDCFACHHSLTKPEDSWRQARGYSGRMPGAAAWNASRYIVFRHIVAQVNPEAARQLGTELDTVSTLVGKWGDREQIIAATQRAATLADQLAQQMQRQQYDRDLTARVMQEIAADGASIAGEGERSAEQAAMALDSLSLSYEQNERGGNQELRAAINRLFQQLDNPSAYNAPQFAAQMQKVKALLPHGAQTASVGH